MSEHVGGRAEVSSIDACIAAVAAGQGGAFSVDQARVAGATPSMIKRRRGSRRWVAAAPAVFVMAGAPSTEAQRRWIVLLSLGDRAVISHQWAGRIHGLPGLLPEVWAVILPPSDHRQRRGLVIHQQQLHESDRVLVDGFPVTSVPRTVVDLAAVVAPARLRLIVEAAHFDLGWPFSALGEALIRVGTRSRPGANTLARVLDGYGPGDDVATTVLEARLSQVLELAGLPVGEAQYPLPGARGRKGLVDRAYPEVKLIVEADGRRWHARAQAMVADRQRDMEAARAGWLTLRLMYDQLGSDRDDVAAALAETYGSRLPFLVR